MDLSYLSHHIRITYDMARGSTCAVSTPCSLRFASMPGPLNDHELLILQKSVAMLDPQHPCALSRSTALAVIEDLLELRGVHDDAGVQVAELQQLLERARQHRR